LTVKLQIHSPYVSNKTELDLTQIAYSPITYKGHKGKILKPKIDKISVTVEVNCIEDQKGIKENLWDLAKEDDSPHFTNAVFEKGKPKRYKTNVSLADSISGKSILIQAEPFNKEYRFLRFEFNPTKLGKKGMAFFRDHIPEFLGPHIKYKSIAETGRITRIDIACDLIDVPMALLVFYDSKPKNRIVYIGETGNIETIYPAKNSETKPSDIIVYDKLQEQKKKGFDPLYGLLPDTRLEVKKGTTLPITKLAMLKNPFEKIAVFAPGDVTPPEQDHHWKLFFDVCRFRGIDAALEMLPEDIRQGYEDELAKAKKEFWRPEKIWSYWPETLEKSGLLEP